MYMPTNLPTDVLRAQDENTRREKFQTRYSTFMKICKPYNSKSSQIHTIHTTAMYIYIFGCDDGDDDGGAMMIKGIRRATKRSI